jgi:hypothetical protein
MMVRVRVATMSPQRGLVTAATDEYVMLIVKYNYEVEALASCGVSGPIAPWDPREHN